MQALFEDFLDDISRCFVRQDVALWRSRLILPFSIVTKAGPVVLPTEEAVDENFRHYLKAMDILGVDMVDRAAKGLEDCRDGTWLGTFQTRLVGHGELLTAPYTSTALLHLRDARFRMSSVLNGRDHSEWIGATDR